MKLFFTILLIGCTLSSCSQNLKDDFPTEIKTNKTSEHQRVEGAKIFVKVPDDFKFIENLSRYQKSDNLYIQIVESNASNFYKAKPNFSREVIESKGAKVDFIKDIKLQDFDGVYADGPSKKANERKAILIFGDNEFVVFVVGVYPKNNLSARNEILEIFKNLVYQKSFKLDPFELANFEFDQKITNFKYANTMSNMFTYTENGIPEKVGEFSTSINIGSMPKMSSGKSKEFIMSIVQNAKNSGVNIKSSEVQTIKIGDYPATVLETEVEVDNKAGVMYFVLINGSESSVIFMGTAFDRKSELLEKYKETVKTIRIK